MNEFGAWSQENYGYGDCERQEEGEIIFYAKAVSRKSVCKVYDRKLKANELSISTTIKLSVTIAPNLEEKVEYMA